MTDRREAAPPTRQPSPGIDGITHRVVLNDGTLDTGNIDAGASSQPMAINTGGGPYHCSIHPSMVGTIVPATTASQYRVR